MIVFSKRPDGIYTKYHLENWTDRDFSAHSAATRKTLAYLVELENFVERLQDGQSK